MKKSLVALAALAATGAFAQSSVTLSGIMDAGYQSGKSYGQTYSLVGQSAARTTTFKFNGVEDMGGGNKAKFQFEVQPLIVAGDGNQFSSTSTVWGVQAAANGASQAGPAGYQNSGLVGKGYTYVGVEGGFGEVQFGTLNSASLAAHSNGAGAWNTGVGSGYGLTVGSTSSNTFTRFESSWAYISPIVNGLSARYLTNFKNDSQYGTSTSGVTARRPAINEIGLQYANGPLQLNVASLTTKASTNESTAAITTNYGVLGSNITTKTTTMSASYDMGVARVGYTNSKITNDAPDVALITITSTYAAHSGKTNSKANMLYAQVPMGQARLLVSTGDVKLDGTPVAVLVGQKTNVNGLAVEYDLSKRTYAYARYQAGKARAANAATTIVNGATSTVTLGAQLSDPTYSLTAIGISHQF